MEHDLWNGLRLRIPEGEVPLGADSLLLADFLPLPPRARVADLGAGCGFSARAIRPARSRASSCGRRPAALRRRTSASTHWKTA